MWLTGFDVECLSTLYIDKPMKAHTLMQAIARANRVYPGKDFGLIVDYNGMLQEPARGAGAVCARRRRRRAAEEIVAPIEERVQALLEAIEATEAHLRGLGFDPAALLGAKGFARIEALADAVEAVYTIGRGQAPVRDPGAAGVHPLQGAADGADALTPMPSGTTTSRRSTRS